MEAKNNILIKALWISQLICISTHYKKLIYQRENNDICKKMTNKNNKV